MTDVLNALFDPSEREKAAKALDLGPGESLLAAKRFVWAIDAVERGPNNDGSVNRSSDVYVTDQRVVVLKAGVLGYRQRGSVPLGGITKLGITNGAVSGAARLVLVADGAIWKFGFQELEDAAVGAAVDRSTVASRERDLGELETAIASGYRALGR